MSTPTATSPAHQPVSSWIGEFILLAALWGASFLFMRLGAAEFGPLPTAGLRVALATVFLWPIMLRQGHFAAFKAHWRPIMLAGVINSAIPFALFAWAVMHIQTGLSSILNATVPLFGALVAWIWLGDRINRLRWAGLALGFVGVALLAWRAPAGTGFKTDSAHWAIAACLVASAFYGISASFTRRHLTGVPPLATATGSQLGATLALALPTLWLWPVQLPGARAWGAIAAIAVLCTGIAYILYFRLIAHAGPSRALAVTFITPVFAVMYGALFLGENITLWMVGCALVIVCGTMLSTGLIRTARARAASVERA
ncbi:DMT family transporter [Acidovorax sp.]|uniref:DMT family transporter n=1 Tax=Acidovorax sp. TaxID=1872122 RepID=UPI00391C7D7C